MTFRISFKIGGRVQLNQAEVLPVTLALYDRNQQIEELVSFLAPLPKPLEAQFKQWQYYIGLQGTRRVAKHRDPLVSGVVNMTTIANTLKAELNQWLSREGWIDENGQTDLRVSQVLEEFRAKITHRDDVQIIVQTEDRQLRGLPWQEWDTLAGYTANGVEVAISATNFKRLVQQKTSQLRATVRILVVLGDEKLGFAQEEDFLNSLKRYGGETHILRQPSRPVLEQTLQDRQGWHIFFFAGHSESDRSGRIGRIQINLSDGADGIIDITDLKELLARAIETKLQLAIFNSCDGLGLANQLTELSLPYCIVMREMVESAVARELLRHFLAAFVRDRPLFAAMNAARRQLQQDFEPGKSWLPVIVANPLATELTWNRLFSERRLAWQAEIILSIVAIVLLMGLPIGILSESGWEALTLYARLYPHLVIYPSLILWLPLLASYKAHCMIRVKTRAFVALTLVTVFLTLAALFVELTGNRMMLMEFKPTATTTIQASQLPQLYAKWNVTEAELSRIPPEIFNSREAFDRQGNLTVRKSHLEAAVRQIKAAKQSSKIKELQGLMRIATSYQIWQHKVEAFSIGRWFYAFNFVAIISCGLQLLTLIFTILFVPDSVFNKTRYLTYLVLCEFGILAWVPFQSYSIEHTKSLLFSTEFRGTFAGLNVLLYAIVLVLSVATFSSISKSASQTYRPILQLGLAGSLGLAFLSSWLGTSLIDQLFGMRSLDPLTPWFTSTIFFAVVFCLLVRLIDLRVEEK